MERELGWESVCANNNEDFGPDSLSGRGADREVVLTRTLRDKIEAVFVHVFRAYPTVPSPYYVSMAPQRVAKDDKSFSPKLTIIKRMTQAITRIERAQGFLAVAQLSSDWVREVGERAWILAVL